MVQNDWSSLLESEFEKPYYSKLKNFISDEYASFKIFPDRCDIFNAFRFTSYVDTKVVILGQDPYHGDGQAHGLSFSVKPGISLPPSLRNIFTELKEDIGCAIPKDGHLLRWAEQGVLLLNTVLTVREGEPCSHTGVGWEVLTDHIISLLNARTSPVIFILWGKHAQQKEQLITSPQHTILKSPHPSPFSARRGFFGSRPFSTVNQILRNQGKADINWCL